LKDNLKIDCANNTDDEFYKLENGEIHIKYKSGQEYVGKYVVVHSEQTCYHRDGFGTMSYKDGDILYKSTWKDDKPIDPERSRVFFKESPTCLFIGNIGLDAYGKLEGNGENILCYGEKKTIEYNGKWEYKNDKLTGDGDKFLIKDDDDDDDDDRTFLQPWKILNNKIQSVKK
jgi:hypothetical protein